MFVSLFDSLKVFDALVFSLLLFWLYLVFQ
jgi:hypothetical protein